MNVKIFLHYCYKSVAAEYRGLIAIHLGGRNLKKPNVVFLLADDLGIGDLSCYNSESKLRTENIDRLAENGLRCTDAHASSALCSPSRYGLMTGRYNWRSKLKARVLSGHSSHLIEDGRLTLGSFFKREGYNTACVGKWHLGLDWETREQGNAFGLNEEVLAREKVNREPLYLDYGKPVQNGPNQFGFDYCYITPGSLDIAPYVYVENDKITQRPTEITGTSEFWPTKNTGTGKEIPYMSHWPKGPAAPDYDHRMVVPESAEKVLLLIDEYAEKDDPFFLYYPIHAPHVPCLPTPEFEGKSCLGPYGDMVLMIDHILGQIVGKLSEKGCLDNTIILFASDNGSEHEFPEEGHKTNANYRGFKSDIWDGGHRIPYIIRYPAVIPKGSVCEQVVCLTDILATFSELFNRSLRDNEGEDSISNLSLWKGGQAPVRTATVHHSGGGMFAIRKGKWKLEFCPDGGGFSRPGAIREDGLPNIQLYDMENDVCETKNLFAQYPQIVAELTDQLTNYVLSGRSTPGMPQKNTGPEWWPELNWLPEP
jgi:arylsulfatase A-like enzyme